MAGGKPPEDLEPQNGFFIESTILTSVDNTMMVACEDIFGSVLSVIPIESEEEVIRHASGTPYGLTVAVWAKDVQRLTELPTPSRPARSGSTLPGHLLHRALRWLHGLWVS